MLKGNKGEWSEFYAFLKILSEGKLFAANKGLQVIPDKFFDVLEATRIEAKTGKKTYDLIARPGQVVTLDENSVVLGVVNRSALSKKAEKIFQKIKSATGSTFSIPLAQEVMTELSCTQMKADSAKKADLFLKIYDRISPTTPDLGFSIKSMLGSASTLLNPSRHTNFVYKLSSKVDLQKINAISGTSKIQDRLAAIEQAGATVEYSHMDSEKFERNLRMVDTMFPHMIALALKSSYVGEGKTFVDIIKVLSQKSLIQDQFQLSESDYVYKLKHFLMSVALGMSPAGKWDGLTEAHGGYIVVREDGALVCYHLYNRDQFQDYLFENTKLDTPSSSRYQFGMVYEENGEQFIKLNLQVRFLK